MYKCICFVLNENKLMVVNIIINLSNDKLVNICYFHSQHGVVIPYLCGQRESTVVEIIANIIIAIAGICACAALHSSVSQQ